ncbi:MAG TPA: hypothetical protein VH877_24280 [Polyangia bacterium]|jgi:hypothetical protein|nr:hypothetical protein [Polyangia bacterium]
MPYLKSLFLLSLLGLGACIGPPPPPCADGVRDGNESDVDCGGQCAPCTVGRVCRADTDCASGSCGLDGRCAANSCTDGVRDGNESDVDCGGNQCVACPVGALCRGGADCQSALCGLDGRCAVNPCANGVRDGNETDVDCGGGVCADCPAGGLCRTGPDCASGYCGANGRCATNSCADGVRDGNETDVDCGGGLCSTCSNGRRCYSSTDCTSGICNAGVCSTTRYQGGPVPPSGTAIYRIQPGAGTVVQPGVQPGYGITANFGGSYRLVWTGDSSTSGTYREFWGSVWTPGTFSSVTRGCFQSVCTLEQGDYVSNPIAVAGGQRIDFDAYGFSELDGFDFVVSAEPVYFDLFIDGVRYPNLVFFPATDNGGQVSNVGTIPFGLTTQ